MFATNSTMGFVSPQYNWNLSLPAGWKVPPKTAIEANHELGEIEVFAHPHDPSLSMTWMRSRNEISNELWHRYSLTTSMIGLIPPAEAHDFMMQVFPLMGKAASAFVVATPDGKRALEVTEQIKSTGSTEPMRGYHLVLPLKSANSEALYMQQLVFYARASKFAQEIVDIIRSARSFTHIT